MKAVLTITVHYDNATDPTPRRIEALLHTAAQFLADEGLLADADGYPIVDEWSSKVEVEGC